MNVVVIVFYSICGAWLIALSIFAIVKKIKLDKQKKAVKKFLNNDETREEVVNQSEK